MSLKPIYGVRQYLEYAAHFGAFPRAPKTEGYCTLRIAGVFLEVQGFSS